MKMNCLRALVFAVMFAAVACQAADAAIIASTDFDGRTVSGATADDLTWTTSGVLDPGSLTAVDEDTTGFLAGLHDTADAQDRFVPNMNIQNEGPWSVTIPLVLTDMPIVLQSMSFDFLYFSNSGDLFAASSRDSDYLLTVTGSSSGLLGTQASPTQSAIGGGSLSIVLDSPILLDTDETYDLKLVVSSAQTIGVNLGIDNLVISGQAIPEPSTFLLLGLGMFGLAWHRRS